MNSPTMNPPTYVCPVCSRHFNKKANLKVHSRKHTGEKPYACTKPFCKRRFMWKSSVTFHEQNCSSTPPLPSPPPAKRLKPSSRPGSPATPQSPPQAPPAAHVPPPAHRIPITIDLSPASDDDGEREPGAGGVTAGLTSAAAFLRTGNPFKGFAPMCSPVPVVSPLVVGMGTMPLSPLFHTTAPLREEHRGAPEPLEPAVGGVGGRW